MNDDKAKKLSAAKRMLKEFQKKQTGDSHIAEPYSHNGSEGNPSTSSERQNGQASLQHTQQYPQFQESFINPSQQYIESSIPVSLPSDDLESLQLERNLSPKVPPSNTLTESSMTMPIAPVVSSAMIPSASNGTDDSQLAAQLEELETLNRSLQKQILDERETFGEQLQLQLGQLREQIQIHAQTIGILVGEKSQLQAALSQTKLSAETKQNENQELSGRLNASRLRVAELEKQTTLSSEQLQKAEKSVTDLTKHVEKLRAENGSVLQSVQEVKRRNDELQERFLSKESECSQLLASSQALKNELQMTKAYLEQISANASKTDVAESQQLSSQNEQLKAEKTEMERQLRAAQESAEALKVEKDNFKRRHETDLSGLEEHIQMLNSRIQAQAREIDGHLGRNSELETQLNELTEKLRDRKTLLENQQTKSEVDHSHEKAKDITIASLNQQLTQSKRDLEELVTKNVSFHQGLVDKDSTIDALRSRVAELEKAANDYKSVLANVEDVKTALSRALAQNSKLKQEYQELQTAFVRITNEKAELTEKLTAKAKSEETSVSEAVSHDECNAKIAELTAKIDEHNSKPENHEECQKKQQELEAEITKLSQASNSHEACQKRIVFLESHISQLQSQKAALQSSNHDDCRKRILELESQVSDLETSQAHPEESSSRIQQLEQKLSEFSSAQASASVHEECQKTIKAFQEKEHHVECGQKITELLNVIENLKLNTPVSNTPSNDDQRANGDADESEKLKVIQAALEKLEDRFGMVMREKADLTDEKERLEHLVIQLQSETDTIGEYITLYQKQRITLKQQSEDNSRFMDELRTERETLRKQMNELQTLVLKLVAAKNQEPVRILSTGPDSDSFNEKMVNSSPVHEDEEWPDLIGDDTSNANNNVFSTDAVPVDPVSAQILNLLTSMASSVLASQNGDSKLPGGLSVIDPDDNDASILNQMTPNTRRLVNHRLWSLRSANKNSPGECPCCKGQVLVI